MKIAPPKQVVDGFGLFTDPDGFKWLLQQSGGYSAVGLPSKECPVRIKSPLMLCPHEFDVMKKVEIPEKLMAEFEDLASRSKIIRFFDPVSEPEIKLVYVDTDSIVNYHIMIQLQALMSPRSGHSCMASMARNSFETIFKKLNASNLSSFVIYGIDANHHRLIHDCCTSMMASNGRLALIGEKLPMANMGSTIEKLHLDNRTIEFVKRVGDKTLRDIGLARLKNHMRE